MRTCISLRRENPVLGNDGLISFLNAEQGRYPLVYSRSKDGGFALIVINPHAGKSNVVLGGELRSSFIARLRPLMSEGIILKANGDDVEILCEPNSYGVFLRTE